MMSDCLDGYICEPDEKGNCKCDYIELYNSLCDEKENNNGHLNVSGESRLKSLHKQLGYGDASICFTEEL